MDGPQHQKPQRGNTVSVKKMKEGWCIGSYKLMERFQKTCPSCGRTFELVDGCLPVHKRPEAL
jgi:hypothetical protein